MSRITQGSLEHLLDNGQLRIAMSFTGRQRLIENLKKYPKLKREYEIITLLKTE